MTSNRHETICSSLWVALALAVSVAGGCSSKHELTPEQQAQADVTAYEAQIRKIVPDPVRADQLVGLANEFQKLAQESIASVKDYRAKAAALNSNYDALRADFEAAFGEQDAAREAFLKEARALRERMGALTTDSEWEELKKARLRALDADLQELLS